MKKNLLKKSNQGFSLVELIVVIAIIAILVGVAVPTYSAYLEDAKETKDAQFLADLSKTAQLFAAENGLELESIWVAPEVKDDRGVELVLKGGEVYSGDMDAFYAMLGGAYNFETIKKKQNITYREDVEKDTTLENEGTGKCSHEDKETQEPTCTEDGYEKCTCDYYMRLPARGHQMPDENDQPDRVVGNLRIFKCKSEGCEFVTVVPEGNKIG